MYHKDEMNQWFQQGNESAASGHADGLAVTLTAEELKALESIYNDDDVDEIVLAALEKKGLIYFTGFTSEGIQYPRYTDAGRALLASAPDGGVAQVETITAQQFIDDGYAEKIEHEECEVIWMNDNVATIKVSDSERTNRPTYTMWFTNGNNCVAWDTDKLKVIWLPPQPTSAGDEVAEAALQLIWENHQMVENIGISYDVYVEQETDNDNDPIPFDEWLITVINGMTKQVVTLRQQIQERDLEIAALRLLCGRIAARLDELIHEPYVRRIAIETVVDELRKAAKGGQ